MTTLPDGVLRPREGQRLILLIRSPCPPPVPPVWLLFDPEGLEGSQPSRDVGLAALKLGRPQAYWQVSTLTLPVPVRRPTPPLELLWTRPVLIFCSQGLTLSQSYTGYSNARSQVRILRLIWLLPSEFLASPCKGSVSGHTLQCDIFVWASSEQTPQRNPCGLGCAPACR